MGRFNIQNARWVALAWLFSFSSPSLAAIGSGIVVFDTLGPENTYANSGAWFGTSPGLGFAWEIAGTAIIPSASGQLTHITAAMERDRSSSNEFILDLRADAGGVPGAVLWQRRFFNELIGTITTLENVEGPWLVAGQKYWLMASTDDGFSFHYWNSAVGPAIHSVAHQNVYFYPGWDASNNHTGRAVRIEVPEPAMITPLLSLILVTWRRMRDARPQ